MQPTTQTLLALATTLLLAVFIPSLLFPTRILTTYRRKRYQYEVTFGLYMMTPTEKFVLSTSSRLPSALSPARTSNPRLTAQDSFLFLTTSLIIVASLLYLPSHISTICNRAFYYYSGSATGYFASHPLSATYEAVAAVARSRPHGSVLGAEGAVVAEKLARAGREMVGNVVAVELGAGVGAFGGGERGRAEVDDVAEARRTQGEGMRMDAVVDEVAT